MDAAPDLDFSSLKVQAAMRVLGIQESDLSQPPPEFTWSSPSRSGARSARTAILDKSADDKAGSFTARSTLSPKEMWERKQRTLLREIKACAEDLLDSDVDGILCPATFEVEQAEREFDQRKAIVDKMRERARKQMRREAQREIDRVTATAAAAASNREALARRLEDQRKELHEKRKAEADKRAAQHAKVQERVKAGLKGLRERRGEITAKLAQADERVNQLLAEPGPIGDQELRDKYHQFREKYHARFARIAEWRMTHEQEELRERAEKFERALQHHEGVAERLQRTREEDQIRLEEQREKFSGKVEKVAETQAAEDREREKKFLDHAKRMQEARDIANTKNKDKVEGVKANRAKQLAKWTTNRQSIVQHKRQYMKDLRAKLAEMPVKAEELREQHLEESLSTKIVSKGMVTEIVEQNKARISRGDEAARKQTLAKIERANARAETVAEHKRQVEALRTQVIKESMQDKMRVEELRRLDPSMTEASTRRVNDILGRLELPTLKTKAAKEGEEGQQQ